MPSSVHPCEVDILLERAVLATVRSGLYAQAPVSLVTFFFALSFYPTVSPGKFRNTALYLAQATDTQQHNSLKYSLYFIYFIFFYLSAIW